MSAFCDVGSIDGRRRQCGCTVSERHYFELISNLFHRAGPGSPGPRKSGFSFEFPTRTSNPTPFSRLHEPLGLGV